MNVAIGQDFTMPCGKEKLRYEHGNKEHFSLAVLSPYREDKNVKNIPVDVVAKNNRYLSARTGAAFLKRAKLEKTYVVDFNDTSISLPNGWREAANKQVKYAFQYSYTVQKDMKYYFTTSYDSIGNLLSKHMLPFHENNPNFDRIIDACEAKKISETSDKDGRKLASVSLQYSDSLNAFVWETRFVDAKTRDPKVYLYKTVFIHANTGKILKVDEGETQSMCDGNTPPYPKLK